MKKALVMILLLALLTSSVSADILWEPYEDPFYDYEKATGINRFYVVPEGLTVNVYDSPKDGNVKLTLEAGERVYIGFTQEYQGETWAVGYDGWMRFDRLQLEYDNELFMEEFADQINNEEIEYDVTQFTEPVYTWTYPGSGMDDGILEPEWMDTVYNDGKLTMSKVYTDPDGGRWGYVGYYMGRCGWAYLEDLHTENPPQFVHQAENTVTDTSMPEKVPGSSSMGFLIPMVAAVVCVSGVLIVVLKKKKKE